MLNITNHNNNHNDRHQLLYHSNTNSNTNTNFNWYQNWNPNCYPPPIPPSGQLQNYNPHAHLYRQTQAQTQAPEVVSMFSSSCGSGLITTTSSGTAYSCSVLHNGMECYANGTTTTASTDQQQYIHNNNGGLSSIPEEVVLCLRDAISISTPTPKVFGTGFYNHNNESSSSSLLLLQLLMLSNQNQNQNHIFAMKPAVTTTATESTMPPYSNCCSPAVPRNKRGREWESESVVGSSKVRFESHCNSINHATNCQQQQHHFRGLSPLLFSPLLPPHYSPLPLDGNGDAAKNKKQKPNPSPISKSKSIPKAVRRRLQSLTRGTKLVPRKLPPIVIGSGGSSNNKTNDDKDETNSSPIVSLVLPAHTPRVWKSKPPQDDDEQPTTQLFLRTHALLGKGSFATVESVTVENSMDSLTAAKEDDNYYYACKSTHEELFVRGVANHRNTNTNPNESANENENQPTTTELDRKSRRVYVQAESQLAYEAHILGSLDHPNIVRLLGFFQITSNTSTLVVVSPIAVAAPERSVLLTEILEETLGQKLSRWRRDTTTDTFGSRQKRTLEKLSICQQVADALEHVHSHNIAYRDLKPENVGFLGSTLKLFDFGLSREMTMIIPNHRPQPTTEDKNDDPTIPMGGSSKTPPPSLSSSSSSLLPTPTPPSSMLRGIIGTMRYMAPEVCLDKAYDCDCDLYSYSVLCWEVWTHKTPYATLTPAAYKELVCQKGLRPPESAELQLQPKHQRLERERDPRFGVVPEAISVLLEKGWVCDPKSRIRWPNIRQELFRICQEEHQLQGEAL